MISSVGHESEVVETGTSSLTVTRPSPTQDGHLLVAVISWVTASTVSVDTAPSGWALTAGPFLDGNLAATVYTKTASSEPSDYTWTMTGSTRMWGWIGAYDGVDVADPVAASGGNEGGGAGGHTTPAVNVPLGGWLVTIAAGRWLTDTSPVATTWSNATAGDVERTDVSGAAASANNPTGAVWDSAGVVFGAQSRTVTPSQSMSQVVGVSLALAPPDGAYARVYQAYGQIDEGVVPPARSRLYQAYVAMGAGGVGRGRVYQVHATAGTTPGVIPSGLTIRRGGNRVPATLRAYRGGAL